jgi:hypothetical protein
VTYFQGRAPLIPCFVGCNRHPTIPHSFKDDWRLWSASGDTQRDWGNGSRLYEVNIWTWRYGRGRPRMVSIAEAERMGSEYVSESRIRVAETRKQHSKQSGSGSAGGSADWTDDLQYHVWYQYGFMYDILIVIIVPNTKTMIIYVISWYECYDIMYKVIYIKCTWHLYDIITKHLISWMIKSMISSFHFIWYSDYLWYHTFSNDITHNIIYVISYMILEYDIMLHNSWCYKWYHMQNHMILWVLLNSMISWKRYDIKYDIGYDIDFSYDMIFINLKIPMISLFCLCNIICMISYIWYCIWWYNMLSKRYTMIS